MAGCARLETVNSTSSTLPIRHALQLGQMVVYSDFELAADHRLLRELNEQREDVNRRLGLPASNEPVRVYLFDSGDRYRSFMGLHYPDLPPRRAFFMQTDTRLVVYAHWGDHVALDLRHEVAHGYLHSSVPQIPLWIDEGLAEYFEVPPAAGGLNQPHLELLLKLTQSGWQPDLTRLERVTTLDHMTQIEYAEAWAWVHFLLETSSPRRDVLIEYLRALRQNPATEPLASRLRRSQGPCETWLVEHIRRLAQGREQSLPADPLH